MLAPTYEPLLKSTHQLGESYGKAIAELTSLLQIVVPYSYIWLQLARGGCTLKKGGGEGEAGSTKKEGRGRQAVLSKKFSKNLVKFE